MSNISFIRTLFGYLEASCQWPLFPLAKLFFSVNKCPELIYGLSYWRINKSLEVSRRCFDNTPLLLNSVNAAISNVKYYRDKYRRIESYEDFQNAFGFIDKNIVSQNLEEFCSPDAFTKAYDTVTTGGTSGGKPLRLFVPKTRYSREWATMHSLWAIEGFRFHPRAVLRNHRLDNSEAFRLNPLTREVIFDGFRMNDEYFKIICQTLEQFQVRFFHAYPSNAYEFCRFLKRTGYRPKFLRVFLSGSENVFQRYFDLISHELGYRMYNWYGHSEKILLGGYCRHSQVYHMEPSYGFFELIDEHDQLIKEPGRIGEIVGTTLHNQGMPLIRYRTGDFAEFVGSYCPHCRRYLPLIRNIKGRWNGLKIFGADGTPVSTTALNFHDDLFFFIDGIQYIQTEKGKLEVLVIKGKGFGPEHESRLLAHLQGKFSPDTRISIQFSHQLRRAPNGKFVELISEVKAE